LIRRNVPHGQAAGALQSGTLGYFRDHIVNLDGKVNRDIVRYPGQPATIPDYLREQGIMWYCDWT
jgi:hypothetical protein